MTKLLIQMTTAELKAEFSMAGSPEKISILFDDLWKEIVDTIDWKNHAEHTNVMLVLARMYAEVKASQKRLEKIFQPELLKQFQRELKYDNLS